MPDASLTKTDQAVKVVASSAAGCTAFFRTLRKSGAQGGAHEMGIRKR